MDNSNCLARGVPGFIERHLALALWSALFALSPALASASLDAEKESGSQLAAMVGDAFDLSTSRLLYRELHHFDPDTARHRVEYVTPGNDLLVTKVLEGSPGLVTPEFSQVDMRTGLVIDTRREDDKWVITRGVLPELASVPDPRSATSLSGFAPQRVVELSSSPGLVIDAGFNTFVRDNWAALLAGERKGFAFAVPAKGQTVRLVAERVDRDACKQEGFAEAESQSALGLESEPVCVKLAPQSWLVGFVLKPIYLTYAGQSRQLLAYAGLSNITDDSGGAQSVYILYRYAAAGLALTELR